MARARNGRAREAAAGPGKGARAPPLLLSLREMMEIARASESDFLVGDGMRHKVFNLTHAERGSVASLVEELRYDSLNVLHSFL
mmetsp:Transcript_27011/g.50430  ORF Transcript_27011/g.50430 Transcript_27011/m.50430 type:complete len:84 (-) Transcript_27011:37-288(-)